MLGKNTLLAVAVAFVLSFSAAGADAAAGGVFKVGGRDFSFTTPPGFVEITSEEHREQYKYFLEIVHNLIPDEFHIAAYFLSEADHRQMLAKGSADMASVVNITTLTRMPDQPITRRDFNQIKLACIPKLREQDAARIGEEFAKKLAENYGLDAGLILGASPIILENTDERLSFIVSLSMDGEIGRFKGVQLTNLVYLGERVFMVQHCRAIYDDNDVRVLVASYRDVLAALNLRPLTPP